MFTQIIIAQVDSLKKLEAQKEQHKQIYSKARKASIMSAVLPGLGQAYNKKYWKIPIVYAGLGAFGYIFKIKNDEYVIYRDIVREFGKEPSLISVSGKDLVYYQTQRNIYKKPRDFAVIGFIAFYLINIVDANVDAHLSTFDISDDLSLQVSPFYDYGKTNSVGLNLKIKLR